MADPFTLALGGLAIATNLLGTVMKAGAVRRQAQLDAFFNEENARFSEEAATDARIRGAMEAGRHRMLGSYEIAQMRVAQGAAGIDTSTGTPVDQATGMRMVNEVEALTLENNAAREARGYGIESQRFRDQAGRDRKRGEADFVSTLLDGGGDTAESSLRLGSSIYSSQGVK